LSECRGQTSGVPPSDRADPARKENDDKPYLRGWAAVERPSDEDWREVKMAPVSGRPISFRTGLYRPLAAPRALVPS
jgi:hypothetical protein